MHSLNLWLNLKLNFTNFKLNPSLSLVSSSTPKDTPNSTLYLVRHALLALGLIGAILIAPVTHAQAFTPQTPTAPVILVFGDSLSAEYGLKRGTGWVALLQERLRKEGFPHRIMNASISGETTAGGLARLETTLKKQQPAIVLLQLGANDGLRGLPIAQTRKNLETMLAMVDRSGAKGLLIGIRIPPNYGADYTRQFDGLFTSLAQARGIPVVPFLLEGIADNPSLFQADAIHPNEKAQPRLVSNVWNVLSQSGLLQPLPIQPAATGNRP